MSDIDAAVKPAEASQPQPTEDKPIEQPTAADANDVAEVKEVETKAEVANDSNALLKTTAKIDYENHKNNRKFDPSVRDVTDDPDAIRKQVIALVSVKSISLY